MKKLTTLALLMTMWAASISIAADGYTKSGDYYWKAGQAYRLESCAPYRCKYRVPGCCGNYTWSYKTCTKRYVPVQIDVKKHDSVEDLWKVGLNYAKERQRYLFAERKKALVHQYAIEMAQTLDIPIKMEGGVPHMDYGFGNQYGNQYAARQVRQGATSLIGHQMSQYQTHRRTEYWNPDNEALLVTRFSNAVDRSVDASGVATQGLGSLAQQKLQGSAQLEAKRLEYELKLATLEADRLKMESALEGSRTRQMVEEETTTETTTTPVQPTITPPQPELSPQPPARAATSIIHRKCAGCHGGPSPQSGFNLASETFSPLVARKARYAVQLARGDITADTLVELGFSSNPTDNHYIPEMPVDSAAATAPLSDREAKDFYLELDRRTR